MRSVHETFAASGAILRRTELKFAKEAVTGTYTRGEFLGFGAALAGAFTLGRLPGASEGGIAVGWDGRADSGAIVYSGRYRARITAQNEFGTVSLTAPFTVRRVARAR